MLLVSLLLCCPLGTMLGTSVESFHSAVRIFPGELCGLGVGNEEDTRALTQNAIYFYNV